MILSPPLTCQSTFELLQMRVNMVGKRKEESAAKVLKQSAKDFCENTSVHGFSYWVSSG